MRTTVDHLRHHAIKSSLFPATTLRRAIEKLGFVQADPIRSPARAQDLILRHRVKNYKAGDLDRKYHALGLEEDVLYAYGFMPSETRQLLHPRKRPKLTAAEQRLLDLVLNRKRTHPRDLEAHLGRSREINAWGGYSKSTTRTLEKLHHLGWLRVAGRENGVRLYAPVLAPHDPLDPPERLRRLILLIAAILAPIPRQSLLATLRHLRPLAPDARHRQKALDALCRTGELESAEVVGVHYLWPAGRLLRRAPPERVSFLAPFDPLVWDRRRFELFWRWPYRFEAYTPLSKRKLGYYAMPLLWNADVIGWVNAAVRHGELTVEPGFIRAPERSEKAFQQAFEAEVERFRDFL